VAVDAKLLPLAAPFETDQIDVNRGAVLATSHARIALLRHLLV
jgi:hypothetical protein